MCTLKNLVSLSMSDNQITEICEEVSMYQRLEALDLSNNQFPVFPPEIWTIPRLRILHFIQEKGVKSSFLQPAIYNCQDLEEIYVQHNCLTMIPNTIRSLSKLRIFCASDNCLMDIPEVFCELKNLEVLKLERNQIKSLPINFEMLSELRVLRLDTNPLAHPPSEVCEGGAMDQITSFIKKADEREGEFGVW